ncbi:hypothetical protein DICPUDRAFT_77060 [Dictyostelium purpureum]|uniref:DUF599 domain-containing protein n=1 Tax=Dictyostelium purpureum TaxID=5786 RepID=F0ZFG9_DICPU|nr:uncharacterized protein DICPUDRAFT_77060 [Dictyostelium purpureum]EGC37274.1 hypothetical protein DICPUDRAFT_77060 [Dictyostelium purpureum]|eukprot:XP_003286162.1 hypothetical protein DICPUDRAFT_77060 [Dictyostelium purpureum]
MLDGLLFDIIFLSASFGFYTIYHLLLMIQVRRNPMNTVIGRNHHFRRLWTKQMVDGKKDILAVQTLRNMVMSSTLLASTSITLVVLIINILVSQTITTILDKIRIIGAHNSEILIYKAFILIIIFLFSFLNFASSIRYVTHLAFLLNVSPFYEECSKDYCNKSLINGSNHYTVGVRSFYFAMCIILWFFDPIFLMIGTIVILYWLYIGDISHYIIPSKEKVSKKKNKKFDIENQEALNGVDTQDPIPLKTIK